jgi:hypothetical protein
VQSIFSRRWGERHRRGILEKDRRPSSRLGGKVPLHLISAPIGLACGWEGSIGVIQTCGLTSLSAAGSPDVNQRVTGTGSPPALGLKSSVRFRFPRPALCLSTRRFVSPDSDAAAGGQTSSLRQGLAVPSVRRMRETLESYIGRTRLRRVA